MARSAGAAGHASRRRRVPRCATRCGRGPATCATSKLTRAGNSAMMLHLRPDAAQGEVARPCSSTKWTACGLPHRDAVHLVRRRRQSAPARSSTGGAALDGDGHLLRSEARRAHVDGGTDDLVARANPVESQSARRPYRPRGCRPSGFARPLLDDVLREAAHAVAADLRLGAVGVEQAHARGGLCRRAGSSIRPSAPAPRLRSHIADGERRPVALLRRRAFDAARKSLPAPWYFANFKPLSPPSTASGPGTRLECILPIESELARSHAMLLRGGSSSFTGTSISRKCPISRHYRCGAGASRTSSVRRFFTTAGRPARRSRPAQDAGSGVRETS